MLVWDAMSLAATIAMLQREMAALGITVLTVEAAPPTPVEAAPPTPVWSKRLSGSDASVGDIIVTVMSHGEPMTMSHIHEAAAQSLPVIPNLSTVRAVLWSMQQGGIVVKGAHKAPGTTGRRSMTYRMVPRSGEPGPTPPVD